MRIEDFTFEVRDENLNRLGQLLPSDLVGWESVLRFNNVGVWGIELVANLPMAQLLSTPGYGIVVTHKDAGVILSGPTVSAETVYESGDPIGVMKIAGVDDSVILADRLAYPDPAVADASAQTQAYDSVSAIPASSAMVYYVEGNLVPGIAPTERAIASMTVATDPAIGTDVAKSARFDVLGELLTDIASIDGLGFDIKQVDGSLEFRVFEPVDRTGEIRMDVANQTLAKTAYGYGAPELTHAIVAGQGEGVDRTFVDVTTTESLDAQDLFARRIESFIDQRNTADSAELTQAGLEKLASGGTILTSVDVIPSSDLTMRYGQDWNLGDRVTVVVANQEVSATVTQVSIRVESNGVFIGATVGEPNGVDFEAIVTKKQTKQQTRINALERKESATGGGGGGGSAGTLTQEIVNKQGANVYLGQAVYIFGADGTNVTVKLAKADAEITSSKTMGLLVQNLANNGKGLVITEGMLAGLDTSAASDGDPVWLSPTTAGGLVYGIANKPIAPNHLVFIGFVLRANHSNGEIYVKIQNGFENDELHDRLTFIGDTAPANPKDYYYWFNTVDGTLSFRYNDGDSSQWVQINSGTIADAALTARVTEVEGRATSLESRATTLEGVRPVNIGGTGASTFTSGTYLKGNGTSAITGQSGIPATDITSGSLPAARFPAGTIVGFNRMRTSARSAYGYNGDVIISDLNISITPKFSTSLLLVQWSVMYESDYNSVFRVYRDGGLVYTSGYQGYNENDGNTWSGIASFQYDTDVASTPSNQFIQYFVPAGSTSATTLQIGVRSSIPSSATFYLNRSVNSAGTGAYEIGVSNAVIWEIAQ